MGESFTGIRVASFGVSVRLRALTTRHAVARVRAFWEAMGADVELMEAGHHDQVLAKGVERLRTKAEYSTVPLRFLEDPFTLSEVQLVYQALLDRELDKRNFRRKILALDREARTGAQKKQLLTWYRPLDPAWAKLNEAVVDPASDPQADPDSGVSGTSQTAAGETDAENNMDSDSITTVDDGPLPEAVGAPA